MVEAVKKSSPLSPNFDLSKIYEQYKGVLKGAKEGEVVTRFPPEPSGYLHIGHVKAALLNYHYSKIYKGKMILRFDDTNPSKEKDEYVQSIIDDLNTLQIYPDLITYTSDSFKYIEDIMTDMIKKGQCYCDNTPVDKMREERGKGIESKCRNLSPEENLKIWQGMLEGAKEYREYCVRGKIDMACLNKCMRDPVFYRSNETPHHRTGTKFKCYPTYDFACPIVDAKEGVTHAMRTIEYSDRNYQYEWLQKAAGLRKVTIYDFSRVCMVSTCLSKRKLQWFVDTKKVEGWDDPRFPTVRGVLRRGLKVETLTEFMLEQGPSKNTNLMEWDKIFAINKKIIDPICPRFTAVTKEKVSSITLVNGPELNGTSIPLFEKNLDIGNKILYKSKNLLLEYEDAASLQEGEKITLMKWCNAKILSIKKLDNKIEMTAELLPDDKDFKSTKKISWISEDSPTSFIHLVEYDHLLKVKKVEDDMDFNEILNDPTKFITEALADPGVKNLEKGSIVQFERRGYYILDKFVKSPEGDRIPEMVYIPDGRTKTMSGLTNKVDVAKTSKGNTIEKPKDEKAPAEEAPKEKSKKQEKKDQKKADKEKKKSEKGAEGEKKPADEKKEVAVSEEKK